MEGSERARYTSGGDKLEGTEQRASRHVDQHGQPGIYAHVLNSP